MNMQIQFAALAAILAAGVPARESSAGNEQAIVAGADHRGGVHREGGRLLLDAKAAAEAFGWQMKTRDAGKLLIFCRSGQQHHCIPLRLDRTASRTTDKRLFLDAGALGSALGFRVEAGGKVILKSSAGKPEAIDDVPAYNAVWGKGRGFRVGQTLPDIPLYDLDGKEVRFSMFLGKRYIIYCWASW